MEEDQKDSYDGLFLAFRRGGKNCPDRLFEIFFLNLDKTIVVWHGSFKDQLVELFNLSFH